jgi:hypothetical protein
MVPVIAQDTTSTNGGLLSGIAYNSSGLAAKYRLEGQSAWTTITLQTATVGTFPTGGGGWVSDGGPVAGGYEFSVPNAVFASSVRWAIVEIYGYANMLPIILEFELTATSDQDSVRGGLTALPNTACTTNASLLTSGTGTDQISVSSGKTLLQLLDSLTLHSGTVQTSASNTTTSIVLAAGANATNDWYKGAVIRFTSGTGAGHSTRVITGYNGSTKVATVGRPLLFTPDNTTQYVIQGEQSPVLDANLYVYGSEGTAAGQWSKSAGVANVNTSTISNGAITLATLGNVLNEAMNRRVLFTGTTTGIVTADLYLLYDQISNNAMVYKSTTLGTPVYLWSNGTNYIASTAVGTNGSAYFKSSTNTVIGTWTAQGTAGGTTAVTANGHSQLAATQFQQACLNNATVTTDSASNVSAVKAKTDQLTFTTALHVDATATVDTASIAAAVVSGLAGATITLTSPLSSDGTALEIVTGDSYTSVNGRSLTFSITNQTGLIGSVPHIRIDGQSSDLVVAPIITSGTQTITFNDITASTTSALPTGQFKYQLRFMEGSDVATVINGVVTIKKGL